MFYKWNHTVCILCPWLLSLRTVTLRFRSVCVRSSVSSVSTASEGCTQPAEGLGRSGSACCRESCGDLGKVAGARVSLINAEEGAARPSVYVLLLSKLPVFFRTAQPLVPTSS